MKNSRRGITLVELLVASALFSLIAVGGFGMLSSLMRSQTRKIESVSARMTLEETLREIGRRFGNAVVLDPSEGLESTSDTLYRGISSVRPATPPPPVFNDCVREVDSSDPSKEIFSIVRFTTFEYKISPESTLKAWRDTDLQDPDPAKRDLYITYHAPVDPDADEDDLSIDRKPYLFQLEAFNTPEVLLIDADKISMQRFKVVSAADAVPDTLVSPIDGLTHTNPDGTPEHFSYRKVLLARPQTITGSTMPYADKNYITGSFLYGVRTMYMCKSPDGKLIIKDEVGDLNRVLLDPAAFHTTLQKFQVRYYGTKTAKTARLEPEAFTLFPFAAADVNERICINNVYVEIELAKAPGQGAKEERVSEIFPLHTFNTRRPAVCKTL